MRASTTGVRGLSGIGAACVGNAEVAVGDVVEPFESQPASMGANSTAIRWKHRPVFSIVVPRDIVLARRYGQAQTAQHSGVAAACVADGRITIPYRGRLARPARTLRAA